MKTFPIRRSDGSILAFEIGNSLVSAGQVARVLRKTPHVTNVRCRRLFQDHRLDPEFRVGFKYKGRSFVVKEDWGDSSRYWIGPADDLDSPSSIGELEPALAALGPSLLKVCFWALLGASFLLMLVKYLDR